MSGQITDRVDRLRTRFDVKLVHEDGFGRRLSNGSWDGCIGSIGRNASDYMLFWGTYNIDARNVVPGPAAGQERIVILSAFNRSSVTEHNLDVMQAMDGFTGGAWGMFAGTAVVLLVINCITTVASVYMTFKFFGSFFLIKRGDDWFRVKREKKEKQVKKKVVQSTSLTTALTCHHFSGYEPKRRYWGVSVSFASCLFSYVMYFIYLTNVITTDTTIRSAPRTVENYDDILDRKLMPRWMKPLGDYRLFKYAVADTLEHQIWQMAMELVGGDEALLLAADKSGNLFAGFSKFLAQQSVLLTSASTVPAILSNACAMLVKMPGMFEQVGLHVSSDERGLQFVLTTYRNALMKPSDVRTLERLLTRDFETGIMKKGSELTGVLFDLKPTDLLAWEAMQACMTEAVSGSVMAKAAPLVSPGLAFYRRLVVLFLWTTLAATTCLLLELAHHSRIHVRVAQAVRQAITAVAADIRLAFHRLFHRTVAPAPAADDAE